MRKNKRAARAARILEQFHVVIRKVTTTRNYHICGFDSNLSKQPINL